MNNERERARLARVYAEMSDEALQEISAEPQSLTALAGEVLAQELRKRGLSTESLSESSAEAVLPRISGPLVVVKHFSALATAIVAKSVLDSAEIDSFLSDENVVRMVYPNLVGGVKLMVRPEDLETAALLLNQAETEATEMEDGKTEFPTVLRNSGDEDE
jgi:hypothetical protein